MNSMRFTIPIGFLLVLILWICCIKSGSAIMCHYCNTVNNTDCADPFNKESKKYLVNCTHINPESKFCRKIDQTVKDTHRVFRACAWEEHRRHDCYFGTTEYYKAKICICREDGCNPASRIEVLASPLTLATIFAGIITFSTGSLLA